MTSTEHLLFKVAEECAETAQRAAKAACFGMEQVQHRNDDRPEQNPHKLTNRQRLYDEFLDLCATLQPLDFELPAPLHNASDNAILAEKRLKKLRYMDFARAEGTLT